MIARRLTITKFKITYKIEWLYCVESSQYSILLEAVTYLCIRAAYFLHWTMPSVTFLRLSDVSVICRITYLQFTI